MEERMSMLESMKGHLIELPEFMAQRCQIRFRW